MKTDELIRALAADGATPPVSVKRHLGRALPVGLVAAAVLFALALGPRPDLAAALQDPRFLFKFVVTLFLAGTAALAALRLARPEGRMPLMLFAGPGVLLAGVLGELAATPSSTWASELMGNNALVCLAAIPILSLPVLAAGLLALRHGAPSRPALAGAVAGVLAGGLAATLYASHCTDDSPLFVATWYSLAIGIVTALGAVAGRWLLRW